MNARQRGIGLPELMVALTLSLLVTLVAGSMLHASSADFQHNGGATRIDDSGHFALAIMGQALRAAGYRGEPGTPDAGAALAVSGRDAASVARDADGMGDALPAVNGSDVLALRYAPTAAGAADDAMLNCAGFPAAPGEWAWSIFYVALAADGEAELRCKYRGQHGWAADAVVRGVDAFHVLYGIDTDTPRDGVANQYLTASAIEALAAALPPESGPAASPWRRVTSVRLALLLHGESSARTDAPLVSYAMLPGADPAARIDEASLPPAMQHRVRRLFGATLALRNPQE